HQRPAHRDALALAAGELRRAASQEVVQSEDRARLPDAAFDLGLRRVPLLEPEREVLVHGHVRVERVVLEDHRDIAIAWRHVVHDPAPDRDRAPRGLLQPGDEPQRGRLAAAGGTDEDQELAVADLEREIVQRSDAFREPFRDVLQPNVGLRCPLRPVVALPRMKYRWAKKNSNRIGIMLITFAAISRFVFVWWAP